MNWVLIVVIAIFVVCGYIGWKKGIIRIAVSLLSMIATIAITFFIAPILGNYIKTNTTIYDKLDNSVYTALVKSDMFNSAVDDNDLEAQSQYNIEDESGISAYITSIVDKLNIPESVSTEVDSVISQGNINSIIQNESSTVKDVAAQVIASRLTQIIFQSIIYLILFAVVSIALRFIMSALGLLSRLPVIHQANSLGGLAVGLVEGLILVWILFVVITVCESTTWASSALADVSNSPILESIYNNNLILKSIFRTL